MNIAPFASPAPDPEAGAAHRPVADCGAGSGCNDCSTIERTLDLPRGSLGLTAGWRARPYMIISGALRLDRPEDTSAASGTGSSGPVLLALAGDLIGLEGLQGRPALCTARAIVASVLAPLPDMSAGAWRELLLRSALGQQERAADLAGLRCGSASERVRRLLMLLAGPSRGGAGLSPWRSATPSCEQPTLADMAALTDTAEETISRVICAMRRSGDLVRDSGRRVRLSPHLLERRWEQPPQAIYAPRAQREGRAPARSAPVRQNSLVA